jgi:hypothetical protein
MPISAGSATDKASRTSFGNGGGDIMTRFLPLKHSIATKYPRERLPVANRFSLEITFRDCKEIVGAAQQQVQFIWASIGSFHVCLWTFTMTEAWAWSRSADELVDRSDSPRDSPLRRPSHADKRRAWGREMLGEEIRAVLRPGVSEEEIQATAERLLGLAE